MNLRSPLLLALLTLAATSVAEESCGGGGTDGEAQAGASGGPGLALRAEKILTAELKGRQVVNDGTILVRDGLIEAVGRQSEVEIPAGYELIDLGKAWISPGFIDLHSHVGGSRGDINDMVFQTNPGLRVAPSVIPGNSALQVGLASGVTTILYIPGSGTNMGGQGVLMRTSEEGYETVLIRDPGSLKIAQGDNPTRWGYGMGRLLMNHHLRSTIRRGMAYAKRWEAYEKGQGEKPERDLQFDIFRHLYAKTTQVSTHTQYYQLVLMTIRMLAIEFGMDVYIDHGSFDSYLTAELATQANVAAILGPRQILVPRPPRYDTEGQIHGTAWGFQQRGHPMIGFNTDAPVVPQEELSLQAAMGGRYGFDDGGMGLVRGLTIVPAVTAGIDDRVGSIEVGKEADLIVCTGHPVDPRSSVERVWIQGRAVYDARRDGRRW